jgi:5-methylcytosine-specific restriction endonuclease McrA
MPRGFKRNYAATKLRGFLDPRSFVSLPKDGLAHDLLYGKDVGARRAEVFLRDDGRCRDCGAKASWEEGEMHHLENQAGSRCDDLHNLAWSCSDCHKKRHVQVRFGRPQ